MIIEKTLYISFSHREGNLVNNIQKCFSRIMYITRCSVVVRHWGYLKKKEEGKCTIFIQCQWIPHLEEIRFFSARGQMDSED